jgi:rRNA-processing protein FCF1
MRFKINVKSELAGNEIFVLDDIISEIGIIAKRKTKEANLAKLALEFVAKNNVKLLESNERNVDTSLVSYSKQDYVIATHDRALKNKLKKINAKIMFIRQRKYLVIE